MKVMLVALALLALAAGAASTHTCGGACQPPQQCHYPAPPRQPQPQPQPHPCQCQHPPQQPHPCQHGACGVGGGTATPILGQCIEFLRNQCSPVATPTCSPQCQALRQQCCQQLRQVEPPHRYQAIYGVVLQSIMLQQPQGQLAALLAAQMAQQLTEMCGLHQPAPPCPCAAAAGGVPY